MNREVHADHVVEHVSAILEALLDQPKRELHILNAFEGTAGPVPEIPTEYEQILKDGGGFQDDVNGGFLPEDLVLAARRDTIARKHCEGVYHIVAMQECEDTGTNLLDLIWVDTHKFVDPVRKKIRPRLCQRIQDEEAWQNSKSLTRFSDSPETHTCLSFSRRSTEIFRRQRWPVDQEHVLYCFSHLAT